MGENTLPDCSGLLSAVLFAASIKLEKGLLSAMTALPGVARVGAGVAVGGGVGVSGATVGAGVEVDGAKVGTGGVKALCSAIGDGTGVGAADCGEKTN